jgi:hypothetical protein
LCLEAKIPERPLLNPAVPSALDAIIRRMIARDPKDRYSSYGEVILELRQFLAADSGGKAPLRVLKPAARLWGSLYDRPFPEVLAEIGRGRMSGTLTVTWMDLKKQIRFREGEIFGVFSNQEGEGLLETALRNHTISRNQAHRLRSCSGQGPDEDPGPEMVISGEMVKDIREVAERILHGLFRLEIADFVFEEILPPRPERLRMTVPAVLYEGIKKSMHSDTIRRRISSGCEVELAPRYEGTLAAFPGPAGDLFPLFRICGKVSCRDLLAVAAIPEDEFYRLMYLFYCMGAIELTPQHATQRAQGLAGKVAVAQKDSSHGHYRRVTA